MIRWTLRILLVLIVAIVAVVASIPLSVVTDQAARRVPGLGWTQVQGSIWQGRISGLYFGAQSLGDTELRLKPTALLSGQLAYDLHVNGSAVRGRGEVFASPSSLGLRNFNLDANAAQLVSLHDSVRAAGGTARIDAASIVIEGATCRSAGGRVETDTLVALGASYGEALPRLAGRLDCGDGMILLDLSGTSDTGVGVEITGRFGLIRPSRLEASVEGASGEVALALDQLGFASEDGRLVYIHEQSLVGGTP